MIPRPLNIHKPPNRSHSPLPLLIDRLNLHMLLPPRPGLLLVLANPTLFQILVQILYIRGIHPNTFFFHLAEDIVTIVSLDGIQNAVFASTFEAAADALVAVYMGDVGGVGVLFDMLGDGNISDCLTISDVVLAP